MILSGVVPGSSMLHTAEILAEMARILRPGGCLFLKEPVESAGGTDTCTGKAGTWQGPDLGMPAGFPVG